MLVFRNGNEVSVINCFSWAGGFRVLDEVLPIFGRILSVSLISKNLVYLIRRGSVPVFF